MVKIEIDDGRRWLKRHPTEKYDLIVQNTTQHWRSNSSKLLSVEYLEIIKSHLREGGVYMVNATGSDAVARTTFQAFPYGMRIYSTLVVSDQPLVFSNDRWRAFLETFQIDGQPTELPTDPKIREEVLNLGLKTGRTERIETRAEVLSRVGKGELVTDDNMACEWHPLRWTP
jgi:spermidine synthase